MISCQMRGVSTPRSLAVVQFHTKATSPTHRYCVPFQDATPELARREAELLMRLHLHHPILGAGEHDDSALRLVRRRVVLLLARTALFGLRRLQHKAEDSTRDDAEQGADDEQVPGNFEVNLHPELHKRNL